MLNKHIIEEDKDHVVCMICGKELDKIDGRHLKAHNISFEEYLNNYPNNPTITRNKYDKELESIRKRKEAKKQKENQTKTVKCIYYNECGNSVEVNVNVPNSRVVCDNCKELGKYDPSRDMSRVNKSIREKYGVDNPSQLDWVQEKKKETINKNEETDPNYWKRINEKRENTKKEKYGEEANKIIHEMTKKGMKDKYGREYALQIPEFNEKMKETYFKRTGYPHPNYNPESVNKCRQTLLNRYGVINPQQSGKIKERTQQTNLDKYGVDYWMKTEEGRSKLREWGLERFKDNQNEVLDKKQILFNDSIEYQNATYYHIWKCLLCENNFKTTWGDILDGYRCPYCYPRNQGVSVYEYELREFIENIGFSVVTNSRSIIPPQELDIYIPSKNVAIEINGLYWHSEEMGATKYYHINKTKECEKRGIQLIHIFEDEWLNKKNIVKSRIKHLLNVNDSIRINARSCYIKEIDSKIKNEFLDNFHLQGKDNSSIKLGAFYNDKIIGVMTFSKGNISKGNKIISGVWELNRFCIDYNYHVPGLANKFLSFFKNNYEWSKIFTYADRRWSGGNLYYNLGFKYVGSTNINYWYVSRYTRIHRFRLRKGENDPKEITEENLRRSEGYYRIWDCGSLKFEMINE